MEVLRTQLHPTSQRLLLLIDMHNRAYIQLRQHCMFSLRCKSPSPLLVGIAIISTYATSLLSRNLLL